MKKIIVLLTITLLSLKAFSQDKVQNLKSLLQQQELSNHEVTQAWETLNNVIEDKIDNNGSSVAIKTLLELCVLYANHDNSDSPYDFAFTIKHSNIKRYQGALKELSPPDRKRIKEFIDIAEEVEEHGNG